MESAATLSARIDVALDLPRMRHMSIGMRTYAEELAKRAPCVAPDFTFATFVRESALDCSEQIRLPRLLRRANPRLVHHLSVYAPLLGPRPFVITIHDLIHLRFPQYFKSGVGAYYATVVRAVCARAARVITDDERTTLDLERYLGVPPRKVAVVALGVDDAFRIPIEAPPPGRPYFLYVGNHRPHKDLPTLFSAWESLDPAVHVDLLVTGDDDLGRHDIRPRRARGELRFLGTLATERLPALYKGAVALVHPALCEGFGLPLLEALAVGTRVIACADAIPALLRPYANVFPSRDVRALTALMSHAFSTPGERDAAREFARTLTWNRCAQRTAEVYRNVLEDSRGS